MHVTTGTLRSRLTVRIAGAGAAGAGEVEHGRADRLKYHVTDGGVGALRSLFCMKRPEPPRATLFATL